MELTRRYESFYLIFNIVSFTKYEEEEKYNTYLFPPFQI